MQHTGTAGVAGGGRRRNRSVRGVRRQGARQTSCGWVGRGRRLARQQLSVRRDEVPGRASRLAGSPFAAPDCAVDHHCVPSTTTRGESGDRCRSVTLCECSGRGLGGDHAGTVPYRGRSSPSDRSRSRATGCNAGRSTRYRVRQRRSVSRYRISRRLGCRTRWHQATFGHRRRSVKFRVVFYQASDDHKTAVHHRQVLYDYHDHHSKAAVDDHDDRETSDHDHNDCAHDPYELTNAVAVGVCCCHPCRVLQVQGVSVEIGGRLVVDQASFTIMPRDKVGLVGRNGAGKTTFFRVLGGET